MFHRNKAPQYNQQKLNRAITSGVLRIVVAGYIIFIAVNIINGTKTGASSIPAWAGTLIGYVFIAASAGFIIYAIRSFIKAFHGARIDSDTDTDSDTDAEEKEREKEQTQERKRAPQKEKTGLQPGMSIAEKVRAAQAMIPPEKKNETD